jgi:hypothetical protein
VKFGVTMFMTDQTIGPVELAREVEARRALGQEIVQLRIHKEAFDLLPEFVRKLLLKKIVDARS